MRRDENYDRVATGECTAGIGRYRSVVTNYALVWRQQNISDHTARSIVPPFARGWIGRHAVAGCKGIKTGLRDRTS